MRNSCNHIIIPEIILVTLLILPICAQEMGGSDRVWVTAAPAYSTISPNISDYWSSEYLGFQVGLSIPYQRARCNLALTWQQYSARENDLPDMQDLLIYGQALLPILHHKSIIVYPGLGLGMLLMHFNKSQSTTDTGLEYEMELSWGPAITLTADLSEYYGLTTGVQYTVTHTIDPLESWKWHLGLYFDLEKMQWLKHIIN